MSPAPRPGAGARPRLPWLAALLLGLLPSARADAPPLPRGAPLPQDNPSHVCDDDPRLLKAFADAAAAVEAGRPELAAERLQGVIEARFEDEGLGRLAPQVVAVGGQAVYEGAWRVAHHTLARGDAALRRAYAALEGPRAATLLRAAASAADEDGLREVVRRHLTLPEGRQAALLLADLAAERGDDDAALGWLERLEDLEELLQEPEAERAAWRSERVRRQARLLAPPGPERPALERRLEEAAALGPKAAVELERTTWSAGRGAGIPPVWTTTGGAPHRAGAAAPLGTRLSASALAPFDPDVGVEELRLPAPGEPARTSPWLPPRAVVGRTTVFVCDGGSLLALERRGLRRLDRVIVRRGDEGRAFDVDDAQRNLPLSEGAALTLEELPGGLARVYVTTQRRLAQDDEPRAGEGSAGRRPDGSLTCFVWDGQRLLRRWRAGGIAEPGPAVPAGLSLAGAPCLYRGLLWVAGARPTQATADRLECWLLAFEPATGRVRRQVLLGTGSPVRAERPDEALPSAPAAARGRVVVATSLGLVAAVDAEDGRPLWIYRHDRGLERGRARRRGSTAETVTPRSTGFSNEPPVIAFGLVVVGPTDSDRLYGLLTRPRGASRDLERWDALDRASYGVAIEHVAGAVAGGEGVAPALVVVGQGLPVEAGAPGNVVLGLEPRLGDRLWQVAPATGRAPVPYGRALVTQREVFVATPQGLLAVDLSRPAEQRLLTPPPDPDGDAPPLAWLGNLVPVPGEGLLAVNLTHAALWRRPPTR